MRIRVEFTHPVTGKKEEIIMDGPEMDPDELKEIVLEVLTQSELEDIPENFDLKITEIAVGTIH